MKRREIDVGKPDPAADAFADYLRRIVRELDDVKRRWLAAYDRGDSAGMGAAMREINGGPRDVGRET